MKYGHKRVIRNLMKKNQWIEWENTIIIPSLAWCWGYIHIILVFTNWTNEASINKLGKPESIKSVIFIYSKQRGFLIKKQ